MEALGRLFTVLPVADDVYVDLTDAAGVTFVGVNAAGETWTLTEEKSDGSGDQVLATITKYRVSATNGAAWVTKTQAAASTVVTTASEDCVVIEIEGTELSAGYSRVKLTSTGSGTVVALPRDLMVQRDPASLPAMV